MESCRSGERPAREGERVLRLHRSVVGSPQGGWPTPLLVGSSQRALATRYGSRSSTMRSPRSTRAITRPGNLPTRSVRSSRSMVMSCETFATESLGRPEALAGTNALPGASNSRRFELSSTAITVWMRLRLNAFAWTTITGRRKPGSEPAGSGSVIHQTSPRCTTNERTGRPWLGRA